MEESNFKNIFASLLAFFLFSFFFFFSMGLTYRGLRFLSNYQITSAKLTDCDKEEIKGDDYYYYSFKLYFEGFNFIVKETEDAEYNIIDAIFFRDAEPEIDWCSFKNQYLTVYYWDKLKVGIPFNFKPGNINAIELFWMVIKTEFSNFICYFAPFIALIGIIILIIYAFYFYNDEIIPIFNFDYPRGSANNKLLFTIHFFNNTFSSLVTLILASILSVGLGLSVIKGLLFVENGDNYTMGLSVYFGASLIILGPGAIIEGVHYIKTTKNDFIKFAKNLLIIAGLARLVYNSYNFFINFNLHESAPTSSTDLFVDILSNLFS